MKVTIECEDTDEALAMLKSGEAWSALRMIDNLCRNQLKYCDSGLIETVVSVRAHALTALGMLNE